MGKKEVLEKWLSSIQAGHVVKQQWTLQVIIIYNEKPLTHSFNLHSLTYLPLLK